MVVGVLRVSLHVPAARSLKDRRMAVKRAVERVRARFRVAVAEVGDLSLWQRATVAVCAVGNERAHVNEVLDRCFAVLASAGEAQVLERELLLQSYSDREPLAPGSQRFAGLDAGGPSAYGVEDDDPRGEDDEEDRGGP